MRPYLLARAESLSSNIEQADAEAGRLRAEEFLRGFMRGRAALTPAQAGDAMAGLGFACQREGARMTAAMLRGMRDAVAARTSHAPPAPAAPRSP